MAFAKIGDAQPGSMAYVLAARAAVYQEQGDNENFATTRAALEAKFTTSYQNSITRAEGVEDLIKEARLRLSGARIELAAISAHGATIDAELDAVIAKIKAFDARIEAFNSTQTVEMTLGGPSDGETGGLDTSTMVVSGWGAAIHQKLLTKAGSLSTYLQSASNTPSGGGGSVEAWVPSYLTLRDG